MTEVVVGRAWGHWNQVYISENGDIPATMTRVMEPTSTAKQPAP